MRLGPFDGAAAAEIETVLRTRGAAFVRVNPAQGLGVYLDVDPKALREDPELPPLFGPRLESVPSHDEFRCLDCDAEATARGACPACHDDAVVEFATWTRHRRSHAEVHAARPGMFGLLGIVAVALVGTVLFLGKPAVNAGRRPTTVGELFRGTDVLDHLDHAEIRPVSDAHGTLALGPARELAEEPRRKLRELLLSNVSFLFPRCPPNVRCDADAQPLDADLAVRLATAEDAGNQPILLVSRDRTRIGVLLEYAFDGTTLRPNQKPAVVGVQDARALTELVSP